MNKVVFKKWGFEYVIIHRTKDGDELLGTAQMLHNGWKISWREGHKYLPDGPWDCKINELRNKVRLMFE